MDALFDGLWWLVVGEPGADGRQRWRVCVRRARGCRRRGRLPLPNPPGRGPQIRPRKRRRTDLIQQGLLRRDVATATEAAAALGGLWLSSGPSAPWHTPGQAGVTVRAYADLRRAPLPAAIDPGTG
ncbi:DUF6207 family protein [Streptomyces nigrescens]